MSLSLAGSLALLPERQRIAVLSKLSPAQIEELQHDWSFWGRPEQQAPPGDWSYCLICAGRGFGKTRCGAEWVRAEAKAIPSATFGLVGETAADVRDVMVEGPSGILATSPPDERPIYESSKRRLTWRNGATALLFNGTEPDQLRGPQFSHLWIDELAKYHKPQDVWDQAMFGLRSGDRPRAMITTTPRPIPIIRELMKSPRCVVIRGRTTDNAANLAESFIQSITERYSGTRLGRQEILAEVLDDVPGALFTLANIRYKIPAA